MKANYPDFTKKEVKLLSRMVNVIELHYDVDSVVSFFKQYGISAASYERLARKLALVSK